MHSQKESDSKGMMLVCQTTSRSIWMAEKWFNFFFEEPNGFWGGGQDSKFVMAMVFGWKDSPDTLI